MNEINKNSDRRFVELGYGISDKMPVYPGIPDVQVIIKDNITEGDQWNGTIVSMYLHAGTHADAPMHFTNDAPGIDEIPIDRFIYSRPKLIEIPCSEKQLITIKDIICNSDSELENADILFISTGHWKYRESDFKKYYETYPALSREAADFIRNRLTNVKAVAIDTLSIENLDQGAENGYIVHKTLMDPHISDERPLIIYEDYNPQPIIGERIISAFTTPMRIKGREAVPVNIVAEIRSKSIPRVPRDIF